MNLWHVHLLYPSCSLPRRARLAKYPSKRYPEVKRSSKMSIKIALVGCGRIAKRHVELLSKNVIKGAELAALCDSDIQKAEALAAPLRDVPTFTDMDEMMTAVNPDAVAVLTPSGMHAEHTIRLAKHRKHIIVEKPMALTLDDADAMIRACDEAGIRLFVIKQNRFNVPVQKARGSSRRVDQKLVLGTVRVRYVARNIIMTKIVGGTWKYDGGVLTNQASHHVDLLEWMLGDVESVRQPLLSISKPKIQPWSPSSFVMVRLA